MRLEHSGTGQNIVGQGSTGEVPHTQGGASGRWNGVETLAAPVSRLVVLATAPFLLNLLHNLGRAQRPEPFVAGLLVIVAALAAAVLKVEPGVRSWILATALCGGGVLGLLQGRWTGSTALLFWLPVWIAGLLGQLVCARVALGVGVIAFVGLYGVPAVGDSLAAGALVGGPPLWSLVGEGLTFLLVGGASLRIARAFADRLSHISAAAAREVELLAESSGGLRRDLGAVKRDLADLRRQVQQSESLLLLMKSLLPLVAEMRALVSRIPELVTRHLGVADASLYLLDETTEELILRSATSVAGKKAVLKGVRVRLDVDSLIARAAQSGEIQPFGGVDRSSMEQGTKILPLVDPVEQSLVGVLHISGLPSCELEGDCERSVLAEAAELIAMGLAFARRVSDEVASLELASPLYRALRDLVASTTEVEVYHAMRETAQRFGADRVVVARMRDGAASLEVVVDAAPQAEDIPSSTAMSGGGPEPGLMDLMIIGAGLSEPLWIEDLADDELKLGSELEGVLSELASLDLARAVALVPLRTREGNTLGQFVSLYRMPHRFDGQERQVYRVFGDFGALVVERLAWFSEAERHLVRSRTRLALGKQLRTVSEPEGILKLALRELGRVLEADLAAIELQSVSESSEDVDHGMA